MAIRFLTDDGLTFKEDRFCRELFEAGCEDAVGAYLRAFDVTTSPETPRPKWVSGAARELLRLPRVQKRLEVLCKRLENTTMYSADRAMREAGEAFEKAAAMGNPQAMVSAVKLRAQLAGHLVERREVTNKTERDLTPEQLEEELRKAAAEAGLVIAKASAASK